MKTGVTMSNFRTIALWVISLIFLSSCSYVPKWGKQTEASPSSNTQVTGKSIKQSDANQGADLFAAGIAQYEEGEYELAEHNLNSALALGLADPVDKITAHKYLAFLYCVSGLEALCQMEFGKVFEIDPGFTLSPAETGHPIWQPVYNKAKRQITTGQKKP
jgi:hypothetical protein